MTRVGPQHRAFLVLLSSFPSAFLRSGSGLGAGSEVDYLVDLLETPDYKDWDWENRPKSNDKRLLYGPILPGRGGSLEAEWFSGSCRAPEGNLNWKSCRFFFLSSEHGQICLETPVEDVWSWV